MKKIALVVLRALWVGSLDVLLSLLLSFARPARFVFKLGVIGLLLIEVMEGMNHWRDLHLCIIAGGAIFVLILLLGFYDSFLRCLTIQADKKSIGGEMKRSISAIIAASVAFSVCSPVLAKDPCKSLICMMGKVQGGVLGNGSSQDGCSQGISDFLSIIKTHNGHMDLTATPHAREDYLNSCPGAAADVPAVNSIISTFGSATL